jgi:GNAT superfamily N-acetyltransferase
MDFSCRWRADFADDDVGTLHAEGFGHPPRHTDWRAQVEQHSLGWVCAYDQDTLMGFVNVAWDGGAHAFLLDTVVAATHRHQGVGSALVEVAAREAQAAGCEWLHVDFESELGDFYLGWCGFSPTAAGILALT